MFDNGINKEKQFNTHKLSHEDLNLILNLFLSSMKPKDSYLKTKYPKRDLSYRE